MGNSWSEKFSSYKSLRLRFSLLIYHHIYYFSGHSGINLFHCQNNSCELIHFRPVLSSCGIKSISPNNKSMNCPHGNYVYILYKKLYKMYTTDVYNMYTKCIQNVYHIATNFCIHFVYKIKRTMAAKFCIQNVYKSLSKCGIHFVYKHFVYI